MAWTSPMTAVANTELTAAQYNAEIRDNLKQQSPYLASAAGQTFVTTGPNEIAARTIDYAEVTTSQSTTSSVYTNLATVGPSITVSRIYGQQALVWTSAQIDQDTDNAQGSCSVEVSGASTYAASDTRCAITRDALPAGNVVQLMGAFTFDPLSSSGAITFTMKYRTGGSGTATFANRRMMVWAF